MLRKIPCTLRWVSAEPLLSELNLNLDGFSFVVTGGESGGKDEHGNDEKIREANLDWFRSLRDQCANAKPPVLFCYKQFGGLKKCSKAMHKELFGDRPFPPHEKHGVAGCWTAGSTTTSPQCPRTRKRIFGGK